LPQKGASVQKRGTQYWSYVLSLCADTLRKRFELDELKTALAKVQSERSQTEHILSTVERVRLRSSQSLRKKAYALLSNELWKDSSFPIC
jgi:flagellar biosynthesis chaperone FliJ